MRWEEQKKVMQQDAYNKQEVAKYENELATKRKEMDHQRQRDRNQELVQLQVWLELPSGQDASEVVLLAITCSRVLSHCDAKTGSHTIGAKVV